MTTTFAATSVDWTTVSVGLLGGLSLFLFGMGMMTDALKALAGDGMRKVLGRLTGNRFTAALTGALVTAVIQSSSVTTVLVVGFITAGLMTLTQSVGVIMGANVGTTMTAQIIAFKVTDYALWLIVLGFMLQFVSKRDSLRQSGGMIMGLGLIFFGMGMMSDATHPLRTYEPFIDIMKRMDNPLIGMAVAAAFTALVQSSSATTGIVIVLAAQGFITLEAGIALAIGSNIGTCATALLAGLGKPRPAVQAAAVHVLFNVAGALLWVGLIDQLALIVREVSPARPDLSGAARLAAETPRQIANAHTFFNVANTVVFIWTTSLMAWLVRKILPDKPPPAEVHAQPRYLEPAYLETPALAIDRIRLELGHLGEHVIGLVNSATPGSEIRSIRALESLRTGLDDVEALDEAILAYARQILGRQISQRDAEETARLMGVSSHLQAAADLIGVNLITLAERWLELGLVASEGTRERFQALHGMVSEALEHAVRAVVDSDPDLAAQVIRMKPEVDALAVAAERRLLERLSSDDPHRVEIYRLESEIVDLLKRVYYYAKRAAKLAAENEPEPQERLPGEG